MLAVMVRFIVAAVRCCRTKVQLAVLMLLASWLNGSGAEISFSNEAASWPRSTFWHRLKSFGKVAAGLYFAVPARFGVRFEWLVYQNTPAVPRPRTSRTATVPATMSAALGRRRVPRALAGGAPYPGGTGGGRWPPAGGWP